MECKLSLSLQQDNAGYRINRYIMECKSNKDSGSVSSTLELIDTLWNVNNSVAYPFAIALSELIDTLWNVN